MAPKPIPQSQEERDGEAQILLGKIHPEDYASLTTWERGMIEELRRGMAVTRIRLLELREVLKRIEELNNVKEQQGSGR